MAAHDHDSRTFPAIREGNAQRCCGSECSSNSGYNFVLDIRGGERVRFFRQPAKNCRISALQADDLSAKARKLDHQEIYFCLRDSLRAASLADVHHPRARSCKRHNRSWNKVIVQDDVRALKQPISLQRKKLRIARARSDEINLSLENLRHCFTTDSAISSFPRRGATARKVSSALVFAFAAFHFS